MLQSVRNVSQKLKVAFVLELSKTIPQRNSTLKTGKDADELNAFSDQISICQISFETSHIFSHQINKYLKCIQVFAPFYVIFLLNKFLVDLMLY